MRNLLQELLAERNMTIKELSRLTGISHSDLSRAINGKIEFFPGWKIRVANALMIPAGQLFEKHFIFVPNDEYQFLRKIINDKGMSVRQVAHSAGMASQLLYDAINGKKPFYPGWKKRVAAALGESVEELFGAEEK